MNRPDQQLIRESLAGQTSAFGELVLRYQDRLHQALCQMLRSPDDAQDVAQDAFVLAFEKLASYRGDASFYSWLFRIAANSAVSFLRKQKRGTTMPSSAGDGRTDPIDTNIESMPTYGVERKENQQRVQDALDALSDEFRTALVLKEMEGLKYEEIASIVSCPIGTVRSRIHRARAELRDRLRDVVRDSPP